LSLGRRARLLVAVAWVISAIFSVPIVILYHEKPIQGKKYSLMTSPFTRYFPRHAAGQPYVRTSFSIISGSFRTKLKNDPEQLWLFFFFGFVPATLALRLN
jgi:hypothetical protein